MKRECALGRIVLAALILTGLAAAATPRPAEAQEVVGIVADLHGRPDENVIKRGGKRLPIAIGMEVLDGDTVIIPGRGRIQISTDAETITVTSGDSPYEIHAGHGGMGAMSSFWRRLSSAVTDWSREIYINAVNKAFAPDEQTAAFELPLIKPGDTRIVAGTRRLILPWTGGAYPFTITLTDASGRVIAQKRRMGGQLYNSEPLTLEPGTLDLTITDNRGKTLSFKIEVVSKAPEPDAGTIPTNAKPELRTYLEAAWLSMQDDGRWRLESYLRAMPIAQDFPPARMLAYGLAKGRTP